MYAAYICTCAISNDGNNRVFLSYLGQAIYEEGWICSNVNKRVNMLDNIHLTC